MRNTSIKSRHVEYMPNRLGEDEEGLTIHGHSEYDTSHNRVHVNIKHLNYMGIIGPLKSKQGLLASLMYDGEERSVLECKEVDKTFNLNAVISK
ncbi:unnamed protein product, partial [Vitis vinifera]|uniref:Uncharacterized protein n=1 Tax=Vitis vinifera TaxID=29760 RepID=D7TSQ5_VITVI